MKTVFSLTAILLAAGSAIAGPVLTPINGVIPGAPPQDNSLEVRDDIVKRSPSAGCNADNVLRALRNP